MQEQYREFHRLKTEIAQKLQTIQDGDQVTGYSDSLTAFMTNRQVIDECARDMRKLKRLADKLADYEEERE